MGWKDTPPGRRVLDDAIPWLRQADAVRLICIGRPDSLELGWAKLHLAEHEIVADVDHVERRNDVALGIQLLDEARLFNADWLVAGAYGHDRITEWVFGGVTEALTAHATLPLFLSH